MCPQEKGPTGSPHTALLHPPHHSIHVHSVIEVLSKLVVKGPVSSTMEQLHPLLMAQAGSRARPRESTAQTSPAPMPAPMASSIPATLQFPSAPTSSFPSTSLHQHSTCSATQIKLSSIRLVWPQASFVGKSRLVKDTTSLAAGYLVLLCGLLNQAGISSSLQLPLKNPAPRFLFP